MNNKETNAGHYSDYILNKSGKNISIELSPDSSMILSATHPIFQKTIKVGDRIDTLMVLQTYGGWPAFNFIIERIEDGGGVFICKNIESNEIYEMSWDALFTGGSFILLKGDQREIDNGTIRVTDINNGNKLSPKVNMYMQDVKKNIGDLLPGTRITPDLEKILEKISQNFLDTPFLQMPYKVKSRIDELGLIGSKISPIPAPELALTFNSVMKSRVISILSSVNDLNEMNTRELFWVICRANDFGVISEDLGISTEVIREILIKRDDNNPKGPRLVETFDSYLNELQINRIKKEGISYKTENTTGTQESPTLPKNIEGAEIVPVNKTTFLKKLRNFLKR